MFANFAFAALLQRLHYLQSSAMLCPVERFDTAESSAHRTSSRAN
jgi:hypothetical protein